MLRLIPAPLQRALMPGAHALRHRWRMWRRVPLTGVSVIVTNLDGALLLLRHSYGPKVWALPGGGIDQGEDPADAAKREVREELAIALTKVEPVSLIVEVISGSPHTCHLFHAVSSAHPKIDRREIVEARYFPRHSLPEPLGDLTRSRLDAWRATLK